MRKLKVFSSREYLPPETDPASILYPHWPDLHSSELYRWRSPYVEYVQSNSHAIELVSLEDADVAILPFDWRSIRGDSWRGKASEAGQQMAIKFAELVRPTGKPLVVFFGSECSNETIPIENATVFRQSVYRSDPQFLETPIYPFFCEDFVKDYLGGKLPIRAKRDKPTIGFRGFARAPSAQIKLKAMFYHSQMLATQGRLGVSPWKGEVLRFEALSRIKRSNKTVSNIDILDNAIFFEAREPQAKMKARMDYVDNLVNSDYIFCCRGSGNYSNRFYEVLSCGRIPVFIDTDCKLPLDSIIDWKKYCVWIDEKDANDTAEIVADFHAGLPDSDFEELQRACRSLWLDYLSPEGFYARFPQTLERLGVLQ